MKRVLIIDDDERMLNDLEESFIENLIEVIKCIDRTQALEAISNDIAFDAVILDWYFVLADDSSISKEILRTLNRKHFNPVFIYSGHLLDFENTDPSDFNFPINLINPCDKSITVAELRGRVHHLLENNYSLQLASIYRLNINQKLEEVLFELNELQNVDIAMILNKFYGNGSNVDWSNDIILNLIHRLLISDLIFIDDITEILQAANNVNSGENAEDRKKIANKILYFHSNSDFIMNGDIACIHKIIDNSIITYGIVITPDCDLDQNSSQFIDLIELVKFNDDKLALNTINQQKIKNYNHDSFYLFQSLLIENSLQDFVAVLKSRIILREITEQNHVNYPKASKRLLYSQEFTYNGERVRLNLVCTKVNPYKAEFLQKLHACNSRVGIPDIKDLL